MEELRTKEEIINYFKQQGTNITEEEIENLKQNYDQTQKSNNALTMQQLDKVAGGMFVLVKRDSETTCFNITSETFTLRKGKTRKNLLISPQGNKFEIEKISLPVGGMIDIPEKGIEELREEHMAELLSSLDSDRTYAVIGSDNTLNIKDISICTFNSKQPLLKSAMDNINMYVELNYISQNFHFNVVFNETAISFIKQLNPKLNDLSSKISDSLLVINQYLMAPKTDETFVNFGRYNLTEDDRRLIRSFDCLIEK